MSDVAKAPIDLASNSELIADLACFSEGVLTEQQIRRKWRHLDNNVWEAPDDALVTRWKPNGFAVSDLVAPRVKRRKTWRSKHRISWER
jgi:hypothetical protein